MEKLFSNIRSIIGLFVVVLSFTFLFLLLKIDIPGGNKDILQIAAGIILGSMAGVIGYYFGSSKNESDKAKTDQINRMDPPPAPSQSVVDQVIKQS